MSPLKPPNLYIKDNIMQTDQAVAEQNYIPPAFLIAQMLKRQFEVNHKTLHTKFGIPWLKACDISASHGRLPLNLPEHASGVEGLTYDERLSEWEEGVSAGTDEPLNYAMPVDYNRAAAMEIMELLTQHGAPFKWWRDSDTQLKHWTHPATRQKVLVELVDVLHFLMSSLMYADPAVLGDFVTASSAEYEGLLRCVNAEDPVLQRPIDSARTLLVSGATEALHAFRAMFGEPTEVFADFAEKGISTSQGGDLLNFFYETSGNLVHALLSEGATDIEEFFCMVYALGYTYSDLVALYFAKSALNDFRQERGYSDANSAYPKQITTADGQTIEDNDLMLAWVADNLLVLSEQDTEAVTCEYINQWQASLKAHLLAKLFPAPENFSLV